MTKDELRQSLSREFDIVAFVDVADVWHQHRAIFDVFKSVHRDRFEDRQRIVLYTAFDLDLAFLDHTQRAAAKVDISNFFILIVCPYDVSEKLNQANQHFGYDDVTMRSSVISLENTKPLGKPGFYYTEHLCPLPFSYASISTSGMVSPCCKFQGSTGTLTKNSLTDIFFNDQTQNIRNLMLQGEKPKECSICWENESAGTTSFRQLSVFKYQNQLDQGWIDDPQVRILNWAQRSLCNFTCRICNTSSSTSIAVEKIKFSNDLKEKNSLRLLIKQTNDIDLNQRIIRSLPDLKHLETLHVLGGEPLLSPDFFSSIDTLIESGLSQNINLELNTNCSIYPEEYMEKIIRNFQSLEILLSVDNVGRKFEVERGGSWDEILKNIKRFASLKSHRVTILFEVAVNIQNLLDLDDIVLLAEELGIEILWWYVEDPSFMCIDRATNRTKEMVAARYSKHRVPELRRIAERVRTSTGSDGRQFIAYCQKLDQQRGQSFYQTHPEIFRAMGGSDADLSRSLAVSPQS